MKKFIKGYLSGFLSAILIISSITVFASDGQSVISVGLNKINILVNGKQVAKVGDTYTLYNGKKVPFSIIYEGTTYLPMKKLGELVGKDVSWNSETYTASLNDKQVSNLNPTQVSNPTSSTDLNEKIVYTDVSGMILKDTTWTKDKSPYRIVDKIQVSNKVKLTIEEGVEVYSLSNSNEILRGQDSIIELYGGILEISGTKENRVVLNNITVIPNFEGEESSKIQINYAKFNGGNPSQKRSDLKISNSELIGISSMNLTYSRGNVEISRNTFYNCEVMNLGSWNIGHYSSPVTVNIKNNLFYGEKDNICMYNFPEGLTTIEKNSFLGTGYAIIIDIYGINTAQVMINDNYWGKGGIESANKMILDKNDDLARILSLKIDRVLTQPDPLTPEIVIDK